MHLLSNLLQDYPRTAQNYLPSHKFAELRCLGPCFLAPLIMGVPRKFFEMWLNDLCSAFREAKQCRNDAEKNMTVRLLNRWIALNGPTRYLNPRAYSVTTWLLSRKQGPPHPKVKEEDLDEAYLLGSGPGGQKIV